MLFTFLWASIQKLEQHFNTSQTIARRIHVSIQKRQCTPSTSEGVFLLIRKDGKAECAMVYEERLNQRSIIKPAQNKLYLHITKPARCRDKIRPQNISLTPIAAFFAPVVSLKSDDRYTKDFEEINGGYRLTIRAWHDEKKTKERAEIDFNKNFEFTQWRILKHNQITTITFSETVKLDDTTISSILNPKQHVFVSFENSKLHFHIGDLSK